MKWLALLLAIAACDPTPLGELDEYANLTCTAYLADGSGVHVPACVSVPSGMQPPAGWPLFVALHRSSGSGAEALSRAGLTSLASWTIVLAPDGLKQVNSEYFNAGPQCCDNAISDPTYHRDLDWLVALIHTAKATYTIDAARVWAGGLSNGGWMATRLACDAPSDIVAAIEESASPPMTCSSPVWIRKTHGTADATAFYDDNNPACPGGPPCRLNGNNNLTHYYSADDATPYGCTGYAATGLVKDYDASVVGSESTEYQATGCPAGTEIDFLAMTSSAHSPSWKTLWATDTTAWLQAHARTP